jgi:hypothetical protein
MKKIGLFLALVCLATVARAADVTGTYVGVVKLPSNPNANANAPLPFIAHLKQEGDKITGSLDGINGAPNVPIINGAVQGDTITFSGIRQIGGMDVKFNYTATVTGEAIDFKIVRDDGKGMPLESHTTRLTTVP